jgi:anti-sigma factor RsiW
MSHLDEGTLHALLDGELEMSEVKEIQAHLGGCSACGTRLRQVKEFYAEADRLVGALELPGAAAAAAGAGASRSRSATLEPRTEAAPVPARVPPVNPEGPPPIFLPDNPDWSERTRRLLAPMKWAALLVVAVGAGFLASEARRGRVPSTLPADAYDSSAPVLSAEEATPQPDSGPAVGSADRLEARSQNEVAKAAPSVPQADRKAATPAPAAQPLALAKAKDTAEDEVDSATAANDQAVELADRAENPIARRASSRQPAPAPAPPPSNVRSEAARALEDLDRERRMERAAAATAALDSARRRDEAAARQAPSRGAMVVTPTNPAATAAPAPTPAPPQRTLEQRADTYMRIGLDEAARQLGRPVHVIEGLSPLFMGLAQGRTSPGADTSRPVVRVVYQDAQGRLILLDQQRLKPGQDTSAPAGGQPHWTMGEILLHLHGEIGPEVLRTMRARVR